MGCKFLEKAENKEKEACLKERKHSFTEKFPQYKVLCD